MNSSVSIFDPRSELFGNRSHSHSYSKLSSLSTIVNTVAYQSIALDFRLWSSTSKDIQTAYLEHFPMLLHANKYKHFNIKQRIAKLAIVRKLLFALQSDWFHVEVYPSLVEAILVTAQVHFTPEDAIKPMVSFIVANMHASRSICFDIS